MSDSELSTPAEMPDEDDIEHALHRVVREALKNSEDITVNLARTRVESQLGLDTGFFKNAGDWKQRSKDIINAAVESPASPEKSTTIASKPHVNPKSRSAASGQGEKRPSSGGQSSRKRRKIKATVSSDEDDQLSATSDADSDRPTVNRDVSSQDLNHVAKDNGKRGAAVLSPDTDSDLSDAPPDIQPEDGNDSDMSSLIDDPPPKRKGQKQTSSAKTKSNSKSTAKPKPKAGTKLPSADDDEIKRLQGWLVKCGVRKLWHRELASCGTASEKTRHLKQMLADVGMTGRYSVEKARQIKERRELAAELEAAQEFNEQWGHGEGEDMDSSTGPSRPRRMAPKGLVDFGDSGEESD